MTFSKKAKALVIAGLIAVSTATPAHAVDLQGSGASFVDPLLQACKAGFAKASGHSYVYTSTGSGTGKKNADAKIGDFWFSDSAHTATTKRSTVFHAPIIAAPIAVLVNLPAKKELFLSSTTVAKIFAGEITKWNDPKLLALNPGKKLPDQPITVVHRADGSGTTFNFTDYLTTVSPEWSKRVGRNAAVKWPAASSIGGKGNEGVAANVNRAKGSIGYVEYAYVKKNKLTFLQLQNKNGKFVSPDDLTFAAAAACARRAC
jgi:phosphate transport system substrate-binding protein